MIRTLKVDNLVGISRLFTLGYVNDGVTCTNIDGLGPVQSDLDMVKASVSGVHFLGNHTASRNIVASFEIFRTPTKTVEQVREDFYDVLDVGRSVELTIESDEKIGRVTGVVESVTPDIFAKSPTLQVSILTQPYFIDDKIGRQSIILPDNETYGNLNYQGKVTTGVRIEVMCVRSYEHLVSTFTIRENIIGVNQNQQKWLSFFEGNLQNSSTGKIRWSPGDVLYLETTPGRKSAQFKFHTQPKLHNVIDGVRKASYDYPTEADWYTLVPFATRHSFALFGDERVPSDAFQATVSWDTIFKGF